MPPKIATNGRAGLFIALFKASISCFNKKPLQEGKIEPLHK